MSPCKEKTANRGFQRDINKHEMKKVSLQKGQKVGLALGGGAVLGAAHVGVLKALNETGIKIGWIAGTSIGALVASLFAFGKDCEKVEDLALDLSWTDFAGFSLSKFGLLTNNKVADYITRHLGEVEIGQASIPLAIVATDISSGNKVVLTEGLVSTAVRASTCIPGIFQPVNYNDQLLVDGGIVENVPISPLRDMGAEVIVAVDLNAKHTYEEPRNMVDVLMNSFHFTLAHAAQVHTNKADILIEPDLSSFNRIDVDQTKQLIEAGYTATMKVINKQLKS